MAHKGTRALPEGVTSGKVEGEATQRKILRRPRQAELGLDEIKEAFPKTEKENSPGKDTSKPLKKASKKKKKKKRSQKGLLPKKPLSICQIGAAAYKLLLHQKKNKNLLLI